MPLAPLTTLGVGGPAHWFMAARSIGDLRDALTWARERSLPFYVLGGGSNTIFSDQGFAGLVIQIGMLGMESQPAGLAVRVTAAAGEPWDDFVAHCVAQNWAGIECLSGIPGFVGATPIQNVGAYGQEVADVIEIVEALDTQSLERVTFSAAECGFGYRASRFKAADRGRFVVTGVTFRLVPGGAPELKYADLQKHFVNLPDGTTPTLAEVREAVIAIRKRKAMVLDPAEPNSRSCGSFFMNPVVSRKEFEIIETSARATGLLGPDEKFPHYEAGEGMVKLSAAWLMEHSGLQRGATHGGVGLSEKHILAIINRDHGTAAEVRELMNLVQSRVSKTFGVHLEPEPVFA
ncbi:MAG: UDP-N-acetylmuramate dehydrogenase [Candidatus Sumerlaeaceae bacterium]|nr:UDP-N-acetylmuramate dehydrogenase [Candidatus Sumerlaeaceae bacterium]